MIGDLFKYWTYQVFSPGTVLKEKYEAFKMLLEYDQQAHEGMAELQRICSEALPVDANRIYACYNDFSHAVGRIVDLLGQMCPGCYSDLKVFHAKFDQYIRYLIEPPPAVGYLPAWPHTLSLSRVTENDPHQVGGKAGVLMEVGGRLQLPVPQGFVITTNAFLFLIEHNRLRPVIDTALARIHPDDPSTLASVSKILKAAMMDIDIPARLEKDIQDELDALLGRCQGEPLLAVRSSAVAEDSDTTFAGQYHSCLRVEPAELLNAYRKVLASKFDPAALYYRIRAGLEDGQTPMAVMVMEMLDPEVSGVVYTRGPTPEKMQTLSIHYVRGFGEALVSGRRPDSVISIPRGQNGDRNLPLVSDTHDPVLDRETASTLVRWAVQLEDLLGRPCDIEWCRRSSDEPVLLQCRPLLMQTPPAQPTEMIGLVDRSVAELLYQGGVCACEGIGCGPVYKIEGDTDLAGVPQNSVVLLTSASPRTISILDRVNAVVLEGGSVAGHFQTVAREFNIPTLVQAENANAVLAQGDHVTVDAGKGKIYAGCSQSLAPGNRQAHPGKNVNPLLRKLEAAMSFITPLELIDPYAPTFAPQSCRSMHDILRFAHEKAIYEMFAIGDRRLKRRKGARRLVGELPMVIYVLDVGGGINAAQASKPTIRIEDVVCEPMHVLWEGMLHPDIQWAGHHHFDWAEYDRLVMNGGIISPESAMLSSYAVVSKRYLNFCLKFGYHFAIIDTLFQTPPKTGHVWFRFTGGGGDPQGRFLRVQFIRRVLEALGFSVKTEGDLVSARRDGQNNASIAQGLLRIGHLLGVTRLLDMHLRNEQTVERLEASFLNQTFTDFIFE